MDKAGLWGRYACAHDSATRVTSAGLDRIVCEACGHISIHASSSLSGEVDRAQFARRTDLHEGQESPHDSDWITRFQRLAGLSPG